jgi:hypothetical protein
VPNTLMAEALAIAKQVAEATTVGAPDSGAALGPVVSATQWDKIQTLIAKGIEEGATVVAGGLGRPEGLDKGWYVRPTVLGHVTNQMTVAREEIFGPVLVIIGYDTVDEAVQIANDTPYGLAAYVSGTDLDAAPRWPAEAARRPGQHQQRRARPDGARSAASSSRQRPRMGRPRLRRVPGSQGGAGLRAQDGLTLCSPVHRKRTRTGRPSRQSSARKVPTPPLKQPRIGTSSWCGWRPSSHQMAHCRVAGSKARSVTAW